MTRKTKPVRYLRSQLTSSQMAAVAHISRRKLKKRTQKFYISFLRHLHVWWRYESTVRELWNRNDRELADLGITRKDIPRVASESPQPEDHAKYRVR